MNSSRIWGHAFTLIPTFREALRATPVVPAAELLIDVPDSRYGTIQVRALHFSCASKVCLVAVHGLGGNADSPYMRTLATAARRGGVDLVRLNLRGADLQGDDFYHAGLDTDLIALLRSPALRRYQSIVLVGFSLGGHIVLRYATGDVDPRIARVIAVCSPLDLARGATDFDEKMASLYRHYVLSHLKHMYVRLVKRRRAPLPMARAMAIQSIRQWDDLIVAPRFGFDSGASYYSEMSVAKRLGLLRVAATYIGATADPMVFRSSVEDALYGASDKLEVHWCDRAGHVGFATNLDLGAGGPLGLDHQIVAIATNRT